MDLNENNVDDGNISIDNSNNLSFDSRMEQFKRRIFFGLTDVEYDKIKIDEGSMILMSSHRLANFITNIIANRLRCMRIENKYLTILDATANCGGDTVNFAKKFNKVIAVEIDPLRAEYLQNNINVHKLNNVTVVNSDFNKVQMDNVDILFVDPPWGGEGYKNKTNLRLTLGDTYIEDICNKVNMKYTKLIVLKLPFNYDLSALFANIMFNSITVDQFGNTIIVTIDARFAKKVSHSKK